MAVERMRRKAADNLYLHKDFHGALSLGLVFLEEHYGVDAVRAYLRDFALRYHAPLRAALRTEGLEALRRYLETLYRTEQADFRIEAQPDELRLDVQACPAVMHMRSRGHTVYPRWVETERCVYAALCEDTPFAHELLAYDPETGASRQRFFRRTPL